MIFTDNQLLGWLRGDFTNLFIAKTLKFKYSYCLTRTTFEKVKKKLIKNKKNAQSLELKYNMEYI